MLEGSEVAEKVRKLVLGANDDIFTPVVVEPITAEPIQKQQNDIVVPNNQHKTTSLQVVNHNEQLVIGRRDVAEMVGKQHDNVLKDIRIVFEQLDGVKSYESYFTRINLHKSLNGSNKKYVSI